MSPLETLVQQYLSGLSATYFIRQLLVILCIFVFGGILSDTFEKECTSRIRRAALAFPAGLCAFSVSAYAMLVIGIPYNSLTVILMIVVETAAALIARRKSSDSRIDKSVTKHMLTILAIAALTGAVAVSGLVPVSISNDSMYFFRRYPDMIVYYGKLRDQFDFWLTDTGLGSVSIDTLPALFGFGETFGIREFFHIDFIVFFAACIFDRAKDRMEKRGAYVTAIVVTLVLVASTPFVILGHWAMANMYFMELFFIAAYTAYDRCDDRVGILPLLLVALSLLRIEGTIFVVWLIICISLYKNVSSKLAYYALLPMIILFGGYCLKIFVGFYVLDNIYLFLTPQKAIMLIGVMAGAFIYLLFIESRLKKKIKRALPILYVSALLAANLALLVYNKALYIGNLKAFSDNLFRQSGWGMFPYFVITFAIFLVVECIIRTVKGEKITDPAHSNGFNLTLTFGFLLIVVAASFGRGDILAENVGDSGNRVLLQITPLIVMTFAQLALKLI